MPTRLAAVLVASLSADLPVTSAMETSPESYSLQRIVPRGEARTIAFYTSLFPDCSSQGPVVIRVLKQPEHGRVTIENAQSYPQYVAASPLAECNTHKLPGQRMVYQGHDGYEGPDNFRILVINADGTGYESDVRISVR